MISFDTPARYSEPRTALRQLQALLAGVSWYTAEIDRAFPELDEASSNEVAQVRHEVEALIARLRELTRPVR